MTLLRPRTPVAQLWHEDHAQWWTPNLAGHRSLLHAGGWEVSSTGGPLFQPFGARMPRRPERLPRTPRAAAFWACTRSDEQTSELQSLMRISYAAFCLIKKKKRTYH